MLSWLYQGEIMKMKVNQTIEVLKPNHRAAFVKSYKLDGVYYLEVSHEVNGIKTDYKTSYYSTKEELFSKRQLAVDYLKDKGIW
jgi:hypothetical protein